MKAFITTLGCPKNLIDTEASISLLRKAGCAVTHDPALADVLVVSACSFLDAAWQETVEEVERLAEYKTHDSGKRLVVMGCLPKHRDIDLAAELPCVDHFLPTGAHERLPALVRGANGNSTSLAEPGYNRFAGFEERVLLTPSHTAYVKIAEGCSRTCTFCAIPAIRGRMVSREPDSIVREVQGLVARGVKEVSVLAQDITSYSAGGCRFPDLIDRIVDTGVEWVRVFYVHPASLTAKLAHRLFRHPSVCRYLECPVQHASDRVLHDMQRHYDRDRLRRVFGEIRGEFPDLRVRSEVIVGFPGETDADFDEMKQFLQEMEFSSLGVFKYSPESNTPAATMDGQVADAVKSERYDELEDLRRSIAFGLGDRQRGSTLRVLVDRAVDDFPASPRCTHAGRYYGQAPDVDGEVFLAGRNMRVGEFVTAEITDADVFDLVGETV